MRLSVVMQDIVGSSNGSEASVRRLLVVVPVLLLEMRPSPESVGSESKGEAKGQSLRSADGLKRLAKASRCLKLTSETSQIEVWTASDIMLGSRSDGPPDSGASAEDPSLRVVESSTLIVPATPRRFAKSSSDREGLANVLGQDRSDHSDQWLMSQSSSGTADLTRKA